MAAWRLAQSSGIWRPRVHPRWKDQRPSLDWTAARAAHDETEDASWGQVRQVLLRLEAGARDRREDDEGGEE